MWLIRANLDDFNPLSDYGNSPLFSLEIHYGGEFTKFPGTMYFRGRVAYVDFVDGDEFSVHELNDMLTRLGCDPSSIIFTHFKIPGSDLDQGLRALGSDGDVIVLLEYIQQHKLIEVYTEYDRTNVNTYFFSPNAHRVVIEEVDDGVLADEPVAKRGLFLEWNDSEVYVPSDVPDVQDHIGADAQTISAGDLDEFDPFWSEKDHDNGGNNKRANDQVNEDNEKCVDEELESVEEEEDDSDFVCSEDEMFDKTKVDMSSFKVNIEIDETDAFDLEDFESGTESDEDDRKMALRNIRRQEKPKTSVLESINFFVGQQFPDKHVVKQLVSTLAIESRRQLKIVRNDKIRFRAVCIGTIPTLGMKDVSSGSKGMLQLARDEKGKAKVNSKKEKPTCPWVLYVAKGVKDETWTVKTYVNEHICLQTRNVKQCTATFLSRDVEETISPNPNIPIRALKEQLQRKYMVEVSEMKIFRAKVMASLKIQGDYSYQYNILRDYCLELQRTNNNTTVKIDVESCPNPSSDTRTFKRIYICLGALKDGFNSGMRPLLGLDGSFMKGPWPGQVLTAVGLDANNGIYPFAYALVEAETKNSWTWFLNCLGNDLGLDENSNFTFISDRQKGIIPALAATYPSAEHRFCLRHIHENMKHKWKGKLYKDFLWKAATANTKPRFDEVMGDLRKTNKSAYDWLMKIPAKHWARSHFSERSKADVLLNNMCEVFNKQLVDGRDKPIITCLEYIREYIMRKIVNVQKVIYKSEGPLTPTITIIFDKIKHAAAACRVVWNGAFKFQVNSWDNQYVVDLKAKECSCRRWNISGIPCKHAVACIWNMEANGQSAGIPEMWVDKCYWLETWKSVYDHKVNPINGRKLWPKSDCPTTLIPPKHHVPIGRPKKKRNKTADEISEKMSQQINQTGKLSKHGITMSCSKCKGQGHNSRSCKGQGSSGKTGN